MISIILYGRNDAHGYNLHRRAALSLNCLAEVLTDDDDEIVFVDYNTPDELPTFIEAFADTLTDALPPRLRVLRVPAALHRERFAADCTHLPAVEPVCRNAAARRANPANRWLLSTNTDMILRAASGREPQRRLHATCRTASTACLASSFRSGCGNSFRGATLDRAISEWRALGPRLRLDEPTLSHEWVRFDAPGDFQLCLRDDFVRDRRMRRGRCCSAGTSTPTSADGMLLHRGSIESLEDAFAGYHCNHSRTPTVYHGPEPHRRTTSPVSSWPSSAPSSRHNVRPGVWPTSPSRRSRWRPRSGSASPTRCSPLSRPLRGRESRAGTCSRRRGVHVRLGSRAAACRRLDRGRGAPRHDRYLGVNPVLRGMIDRLVRELSHDGPLRVLFAADSQGLTEIAESADLFIVDLGLDSMLETELDAHPDGFDGRAA